MRTGRFQPDVQVCDTLGARLRATRLGYYLARRHGCWIRITEARGGHIIELSPIDLPVPGRPFGGDEYKALNEADKIMDLDPILRNICRVKKRLHFLYRS